MLRDDINNAVKDAMRAKDERKLSTLRMVNSTIKNADIAARGDVGVLDGRIDHAQGRELALVLGPHRVLDRVVDVVAQHLLVLFAETPDLGRSRPPDNSVPLRLLANMHVLHVNPRFPALTHALAETM